MTDDELHDLIAAHPASKALADVGNDAGAADSIAATMPPEVFSLHVTDRDIVRVFPNPSDGESVLAAFDAAAANNPLFARVVKWLDPAQGGVDFGLASTRAVLDQLHASGAISDAALVTLKGLAERPATVDFNRVSAAWARHRPDGRVVS